MCTREQYTVGWICAITTEYVAAKQMLDTVNDPVPLSHNQRNTYTFGKVGSHNIVISVLPIGEYGISSAARVAEEMIHNFPNLRIGLMVGIGGGAPSPKHDIRLGDIVVSTPHNGHGGVFQYDYGKTMQDQTFRQTGFLDQPPTVLRAAVSELRAQYMSDGHALDDVVSKILDKKPRLRRDFARPDSATDLLYKAHVVHPKDSEEPCNVNCGSDPSLLVTRDPRGEYDDDPAIHYGIIASANQLMKDALVRDKLARQKNVLCFEMEAAGLMNHFPCLVIRGICDYADSHKNEAWQGYAAMVAAAYARDLLYQIRPQQVQEETKAAETLKTTYRGDHIDTVRFEGPNSGIQIGLNKGQVHGR